MLAREISRTPGSGREASLAPKFIPEWEQYKTRSPIFDIPPKTCLSCMYDVPFYFYAIQVLSYHYHSEFYDDLFLSINHGTVLVIRLAMIVE